jgi:pimeloyl-ACP methyl ester carboxylesterase
MPRLTTDDGVHLFVEETGSGVPILFIHEFAGDHRSWELQVRFFGRLYRCITYNARGYPPSDVPTAADAYSQERAVADAVAVLDGLGIDRAHVVGLSMGGFAALHLGLHHPDRVRSLVVAACGYGAPPENREQFAAEMELVANAFAHDGTPAVAKWYAVGPARVQLQKKNPRAWQEFSTQLTEHSNDGSALTTRGVQKVRPSLYDLRSELSRMTTPVLIVTGDEDEGCLDADLMLKRTIPSSGLAVLPRTGHTCNLEEPELFNSVVARFLWTVEHDRWGLRDPRSVAAGVTGLGLPGAT